MDVCVCGCVSELRFRVISRRAHHRIVDHTRKIPTCLRSCAASATGCSRCPTNSRWLTANLPLGYNRDLQLMKDIIFPATTELRSCLEMCEFMLHHIRIRENILDDERYDYLFTVEDVNRLGASGSAFPRAYKRGGNGGAGKTL